MARILVVDDEPDWQKTLQGLLTDGGFQVTSVGDESSALKEAVQTPFDLAVIDVRLHGDVDDDSGLSLAGALKQLAPYMKVVLLTGFETRTDQVAKAFRFVGVETFIEKKELEKPDGVDLVATVKKILSEPSFDLELDQLSLSFKVGQPVLVRSRGAHVCACRTDRNFQLSISRYNRLAQQAAEASDPRFDVKAIGENLYRDLFTSFDEVRDVFIAARTATKPLSLVFEGSRDFIRVPFEFIFLGKPIEDYLVLEHPVTRFINGAETRRKALSPQVFAQFKGKLRVLIVASNTLPPIPGVDQEAQQLAELFNRKEYVDAEVELIPTEEATLTRVRKALRDCQAHILHYTGHGWHDDLEPEKSALFFWSKKNREGTIESMTDVELKDLLQDSQVRLAYFSCCYGAATGSQDQLARDDFLGISDAVIQAGVPSALGYRWPVADEGARQLATAFYTSLLRQGSPEIALWQARRELSRDRNDSTWLSPILIHQR